MHYTAPHSPWERKHHPPRLFEEYHEQCPLKSVPDGLTPPEWVRRLNIPVKDAETRRIYLSGYYAAVMAMDAGIDRLVDWLKGSGMHENTLVCFLSDNGMSMGHNGFYGKGNATFPMNMFDESAKVPCIFSHPDHITEGKLCSELLSQYDLMPMLLDCMGVRTQGGEALPVTSFRHLLHGQQGRGEIACDRRL